VEFSFGKGRRLVVRLIVDDGAGSLPPPADAAAEPDGRRDLMRVHSKKLTIALAAVAVALLIGSLDYGVREGLPSVALDWLFGLQLIRAAVAFVIVAIIIMLLLRGWGGLWPERILTTGLEFPAAEKEVERGLAESAKLSHALLQEFKSLKSTELAE